MHSSRPIRTAALRVDMDKFEKFKNILYKYKDKGFVKIANGEFICPLSYGQIAYLHKLYTGCSKVQIEKMEKLLDIVLPSDYRQFLENYNGCTLFDNTFFLWGSNDNLDRDIELHKQSAVSLEDEINIARSKMHNEQSWMPVGSISAYSKRYVLEIGVDHSWRISDGGDKFCYLELFLSALLYLSNVLDKLSNHLGLIDLTGQSVEAYIDKLLEGPSRFDAARLH